VGPSARGTVSSAEEITAVSRLTPRLVSSVCASQPTRTWVLRSPMRSGFQRAMWTLVESTSGAAASAGTRRPSPIALVVRRGRPTRPAQLAAVEPKFAEPIGPTPITQWGMIFGSTRGRAEPYRTSGAAAFRDGRRRPILKKPADLPPSFQWTIVTSALLN